MVGRGPGCWWEKRETSLGEDVVFVAVWISLPQGTNGEDGSRVDYKRKYYMGRKPVGRAAGKGLHSRKEYADAEMLGESFCAELHPNQ